MDSKIFHIAFTGLIGLFLGPSWAQESQGRHIPRDPVVVSLDEKVWNLRDKIRTLENRHQSRKIKIRYLAMLNEILPKDELERKRLHLEVSGPHRSSFAEVKKRNDQIRSYFSDLKALWIDLRGENHPAFLGQKKVRSFVNPWLKLYQKGEFEMARAFQKIDEATLEGASEREIRNIQKDSILIQEKLYKDLGALERFPHRKMFALQEKLFDLDTQRMEKAFRFHAASASRAGVSVSSEHPGLRENFFKLPPGSSEMPSRHRLSEWYQSIDAVRDARHRAYEFTKVAFPHDIRPQAIINPKTFKLQPPIKTFLPGLDSRFQSFLDDLDRIERNYLRGNLEGFEEDQVRIQRFISGYEKEVDGKKVFVRGYLPEKTQWGRAVWKQMRHLADVVGSSAPGYWYENYGVNWQTTKIEVLNLFMLGFLAGGAQVIKGFAQGVVYSSPLKNILAKSLVYGNLVLDPILGTMALSRAKRFAEEGYWLSAMALSSLGVYAYQCTARYQQAIGARARYPRDQADQFLARYQGGLDRKGGGQARPGASQEFLNPKNWTPLNPKPRNPSSAGPQRSSSYRGSSTVTIKKAQTQTLKKQMTSPGPQNQSAPLGFKSTTSKPLSFKEVSAIQAFVLGEDDLVDDEEIKRRVAEQEKSRVKGLKENVVDLLSGQLHANAQAILDEAFKICKDELGRPPEEKTFTPKQCKAIAGRLRGLLYDSAKARPQESTSRSKSYYIYEYSCRYVEKTKKPFYLLECSPLGGLNTLPLKFRIRVKSGSLPKNEMDLFSAQFALAMVFESSFSRSDFEKELDLAFFEQTPMKATSLESKRPNFSLELSSHTNLRSAQLFRRGGKAHFSPHKNLQIDYVLSSRPVPRSEGFPRRSSQFDFITQSGLMVRLENSPIEVLDDFADVIMVPLASREFTRSSIPAAMMYHGYKNEIRSIYEEYRQKSRRLVGSSFWFLQETDAKSHLAGVVVRSNQLESSDTDTEKAVLKFLKTVLNKLPDQKSLRVVIPFSKSSSRNGSTLSLRQEELSILRAIAKFDRSHPDQIVIGEVQLHSRSREIEEDRRRKYGLFRQVATDFSVESLAARQVTQSHRFEAEKYIYFLFDQWKAMRESGLTWDYMAAIQVDAKQQSRYGIYLRAYIHKMLGYLEASQVEEEMAHSAFYEEWKSLNRLEKAIFFSLYDRDGIPVPLILRSMNKL